MKTVVTLFCTLLAVSARADDIPKGVHVLLRLEHSVSTKTAKVGDIVHLRTTSPHESIPIGSYAQGVITRTKRAGRVRGRAELEIRVRAITRLDGAVVPVTAGTASIHRTASRVPRPVYPNPSRLPIFLGMGVGYGVAGLAATRSHSAETIAGVGLAAGVAAVVLLHVLARGSDLELSPGTTIDVVF